MEASANSAFADMSRAPIATSGAALPRPTRNDGRTKAATARTSATQTLRWIQERPWDAALAGAVQGEQKAADADRREQREADARGDLPPNLLARLLPCGENDAAESESETGALQLGRSLTRGYAGDDRNDGSSRSDRRDDAHRSARQAAIERPDADRSGETGQNRVRDVARFRGPISLDGHDSADEQQARELANEHDHGRRDDPALQSSQVVGGPPGDRRAEGECDGDHAGSPGLHAHGVAESTYRIVPVTLRASSESR